MDTARLGRARHQGRARLGLVLGKWGATWGVAASSWLLGGLRGTGQYVFLVYPLAQRQAVQPLGD